MTAHGLPCWYELSTADTAAACAFYAGILPWTWADSGMTGMTYLLGSTDSGMVAGMTAAEPGQPGAWTCYVTVDSCDASAAQASGLGAQTVVPPSDIPGTGRFAILIDPQGAVFGMLEPLPGGLGGAFDQAKIGHGNWLDLECADPEAALGFYGALFGWTRGQAMPMGPDMTYHLLTHAGQDIGGIYNTKTAPNWKPYFGVGSAKASVERIAALGGQVLHGPAEVPGGTFTVDARDPQGLRFALVGPA